MAWHIPATAWSLGRTFSAVHGLQNSEKTEAQFNCGIVGGRPVIRWRKTLLTSDGFAAK